MRTLSFILISILFFSCSEDELIFETYELKVSEVEGQTWFYVLTNSTIRQGHLIDSRGYESELIFREYENDLEIFCSKKDLSKTMDFDVSNADCDCKIEVKFRGKETQIAYKYFLFER